MKIENIKCGVCDGLFSVEYNKDPDEHNIYFCCVFCGSRIEDL